MLDRLHLVIRAEQIRAEGNRAVVGEQHAVVRPEQRRHRISQFPRRGRPILRNRDAPERRHHLRQHRAVERNARDGKPGGRRRMRVNDGANVRPLAIRDQMHERFG
jgi:hypothetical protein